MRLDNDGDNFCLSCGSELKGAALENDEDCTVGPNQWFFDDNPYGIVYYQFLNVGY